MSSTRAATSRVSAFDRGDITRSPVAAALALLATVGAALSIVSVVKTTLAFVGIGATVSRRRRSAARSRPTPAPAATPTRSAGLVVQAASLQDLYTIALSGGAVFLVA